MLLMSFNYGALNFGLISDSIYLSIGILKWSCGWHSHLYSNQVLSFGGFGSMIGIIRNLQNSQNNL
jgi:hypothetical protein